MFFLQNMILPEDPFDHGIDPDYSVSGSNIRDNDDEVYGEDIEAHEDDDDNDDYHDADNHDRHDDDADQKSPGGM